MVRSIEIVTRGVKLHVRVRSGRPTLLLLHGLAGHAGEWTAVIEQLDDTVGVIAPDQRGHAQSDRGPALEINRMAFVDDAVALIEQLADEPAVVVGQSMGGIVASLVAHARPDLVSHLVLVEADISPMVAADFIALKEWFNRWPDSFVDAKEASDFFGPGARSTPAWIAGLAKTSTGLVRSFDSDVMLETMRALADTSRLQEWRETTAPTTLIRATESMISDRDIADMLAARPEVDVIEIGDSGHDVHLDQPAHVATVLAGLVTP